MSKPATNAVAGLLALCAAAEAQRRAGDTPPMDPELTALAAEAAEASPDLDHGPA